METDERYYLRLFVIFADIWSKIGDGNGSDVGGGLDGAYCPVRRVWVLLDKGSLVREALIRSVRLRPLDYCSCGAQKFLRGKSVLPILVIPIAVFRGIVAVCDGDAPVGCEYSGRQVLPRRGLVFGGDGDGATLLLPPLDTMS